VNNVSNFNSWRRPKVNPTACSQTGCSGLAPAPELCPYGAPAAATSPCRAFMNKPQPFFSTLTLISFLLNLTHTTLPRRAVETPANLRRAGTVTGDGAFAPARVSWSAARAYDSGVHLRCRNRKLIFERRSQRIFLQRQNSACPSCSRRRDRRSPRWSFPHRSHWCLSAHRLVL
jgi:hypothetical protein